MYLESIYNDNLLVNIKDLNTYLKSNNNNINDYLLLLLKKKIGNKCNNDGLVISDTINIIYRNCGTFVHNDKILYKIKFNTKILFPNEGCILNNCKIIFISSILYIAKVKTSNLIIILPRNFIKTPLDVKKNKYINVICIDKYYELNDKFMFIIGIPYFDSTRLDKILNTSENDDICKNIFNNITEFKLEYESLFSKLKNTEEDDLLIDYEITKEPDELNPVLINLIENLDLYLEENSKIIEYKITTNVLDTYESIYNIYDLLNINIPSLTKFNLNINIDLYENNKRKINYTNFINTDDSSSINNSFINCYIISSIQLLKNSKLFLKTFYDFYDKQESVLDKTNVTYKLYNELNKLFNGDINDLDNFISILEEINTLYKLDFNFSTLHNIYDFIFILFKILDSTIDDKLYIKNVYDDVSISTRSLKKTNTENNIGFYINKLNTSNNTSILNKFYYTSINEYKCSNCLFRYYHIKNKLNCNLFINNNDNISKCIHSLNINPTLVEGLECSVCNNSNIYKSEFMYVNPTDYVFCNLNRVLFTNNLEKNKNELFINNRINIKTVDINSTNTIKTIDYLLDLKSIICLIGSLNNGHYICLNKTSKDFFYLYDDSKKYIVTQDNFYTNILIKSNVCNLVYQVNNINSPLSDILLLQYEHNVLNENFAGTFNDYVKNNNIVGINIKTQMTGGSQVTNIVDLENILVKLYNLNLVKTPEKYIEYLNTFYRNFAELDNIKLIDKELINNILSNFFDKYASIIIPNYNNLYKLLIHKYVSNQKYDIINKNINAIDFLTGTDLYKSVANIYIGTSGYNTNKTNHWDVIYEISNNNLELYSNHFNSIEINDTYYHDFDEAYWNYLENNLSELEDTMSVSIIFNKELIDVLVNSKNLSNDELIKQFNNIFEKYWNNKISLIQEYIHNIVFIFEPNFVYNETTLKNLDLFLTYSSQYEPNFIFEFHNNSWFNNKTASFLLENNLNMVSLIINNNNNDFGYNLLNNINFVNSYNFKVNYIKLYGSISKFNGSHSEDLLTLIETIMYNCDKNNTNLTKLTKSNKTQYIYFNNIETDLDNNRYKATIVDLDINSNNTHKSSNETSTEKDKNDGEEDTEDKNDGEDTEDKDEKILKNSIEINDKSSLEMTDLESTETLTENLNMPAAVFDAKCLYNLLEKLTNLKK